MLGDFNFPDTSCSRTAPKNMGEAGGWGTGQQSSNIGRPLQKTKFRTQMTPNSHPVGKWEAVLQRNKGGKQL